MKFLKAFGLVLILLLVYVLYIMSSTGYFRTIENEFDGKIVKEIEIPGAEDITISHEDEFALISSTARQDLRSGKASEGGLYYMGLKDNNFDAQLISASFQQPFYPHGISMVRIDSAHFKVYAINHVGHEHSIEIFQLRGNQLTHEKTIKDPSLISPNDIVAVDQHRFYFTNDHNSTSGLGKLAEDYLGLARTTVIYYDGQQFEEVAKAISYANGINYDAKRKLLFVASPREFLVKVYQVETEGKLSFVEDIDCKTGVDNIEFDLEGNLWIGCHPSLLDFSAYAAKRKDRAPSEIIKVNYRKKGDYQVETIFVDDGALISATSVATPFQNYILVGNVMDDHFLVLENN